jgi:predicted lipoprotein with Yx(FWY)xxD motif
MRGRRRSGAGRDEAGAAPDEGGTGERDRGAQESSGGSSERSRGNGDRNRGGGGPKHSGTTIATSDSQFGTILFNDDEQAIYLFDKEEGERSECYGACAEAWPPVLTEGRPQAAVEADAKLLGTTERDDGTTQVTYGGHPLYYYAHEGPGEVLCHNVAEFGGLWLVLTPQGDAVS